MGASWSGRSDREALPPRAAMVEGNYRQVNVGPKVTFLNGLTRVGPSLAVGQFESKSEAFIRFKPALTLPEYKEFSLKLGMNLIRSTRLAATLGPHANQQEPPRFDIQIDWRRKLSLRAGQPAGLLRGVRFIVMLCISLGLSGIAARRKTRPASSESSNIQAVQSFRELRSRSPTWTAEHPS